MKFCLLWYVFVMDIFKQVCGYIFLKGASIMIKSELFCNRYYIWLS